MSVLATRARVADVPVYIDGVGTARPAAAVTVRPQVDGQLQKLMFRDGQEVKKGDVLAKIDPATYQAQLDQALAKKAQNEALLENAKRDLERYARLAETNSVTKQQADTQRSAVAQLEAQLKSDQAAIDSARAYARLHHYRRADRRANRHPRRRRGQHRQAVRRQRHRQHLADRAHRRRLQRAAAATAPASTRRGRRAPLPVEAMDADNKAAIDTGVLQVIDNQVDQTTGTVRLKAEFPNRDLALWPGAFANVRLLVDTLQRRDRGADRRRAARAQGHVRLCREAG